MFHSVRTANEIMVFHRGKLVYKRWLGPDGRKTVSALFNEQWPTVWLPARRLVL